VLTPVKWPGSVARDGWAVARSWAVMYV
jgi:hypothetical protein